MSTASTVFTTEYRGAGQGELFEDLPPVGDPSGSYLAKIIICQNGVCVHGLKLFYSWANGREITHGVEQGGGSTSTEITFDPGEFITQIEGYSSTQYIFQLTLVTTRRRYGPFGASTGESFRWIGPAPGMRFLAFSGRVNRHLTGLQATFCKSPAVQQPRTVQYERMALPGATDCVSMRVGSTFTSHLMSPIITLHVGQEQVQFHVHEDTISILPFFRAALQGQFREASEKAIKMPDDDPSGVSAMIQFLYVGNYTYAYDPASVQPPEGSETPVVDLAEGLYHLGVYVVASKYDCSKLSEMAVANFKSVANEIDTINTLRLWKAAYAEDLHLPRSKQEFGESCCREGIVSWVTGLFEEHCEELDETIVACPQLASDLLRIATIGK